MKLRMNQKSRFSRLGTGVLAMLLVFVVSSCATQTSNLGKTAPKNQVLPLTSEESIEERVWQTKDVEVNYKTIQTGNTFVIEGSLSVNDSVTRTFPVTKWLKFSINYLDEDNTVISTDPVNINTGFRNTLAKNLKFIDVPEAPSEAVAFTFSYWGVMSGFGVSDENPGDWEIYFDPFKIDDAEQKSSGNGLFYAD